MSALPPPTAVPEEDKETEEEKKALDPVKTPFKCMLLHFIELIRKEVSVRSKTEPGHELIAVALAVGRGMVSLCSERTLVAQFIGQTWEKWNCIKTHDVEYFRLHTRALIGNRVPVKLVDKFQAFFLAVDETGQFKTDLVPLWAVSECLVTLAIKDLHQRREWGPTKKDPSKLGYRKKVMPDVPLVDLAAEWGVTLFDA